MEARVDRLMVDLEVAQEEMSELREQIKRYQDYIKRRDEDVREQGYLLIDEWDAEELIVSTRLVKIE
jgi:peptidoglycan hydrolase CwlO-like protein